MFLIGVLWFLNFLTLDLHVGVVIDNLSNGSSILVVIKNIHPCFQIKAYRITSTTNEFTMTPDGSVYTTGIFDREDMPDPYKVINIEAEDNGTSLTDSTKGNIGKYRNIIVHTGIFITTKLNTKQNLKC